MLRILMSDGLLIPELGAVQGRMRLEAECAINLDFPRWFRGLLGGVESACGVVVSASELAAGPTVVSGWRRFHLRGLAFGSLGLKVTRV